MPSAKLALDVSIVGTPFVSAEDYRRRGRGMKHLPYRFWWAARTHPKFPEPEIDHGGKAIWATHKLDAFFADLAADELIGDILKNFDDRDRPTRHRSPARA